MHLRGRNQGKIAVFLCRISPCELATDPTQNICSINPWYKEFFGLSNKGLDYVPEVLNVHVNESKKKLTFEKENVIF